MYQETLRWDKNQPYGHPTDKRGIMADAGKSPAGGFDLYKQAEAFVRSTAITSPKAQLSRSLEATQPFRPMAEPQAGTSVPRSAERFG
jgi:hypothetical protein